MSNEPETYNILEKSAYDVFPDLTYKNKIISYNTRWSFHMVSFSNNFSCEHTFYEFIFYK